MSSDERRAHANVHGHPDSSDANHFRPRAVEGRVGPGRGRAALARANRRFRLRRATLDTFDLLSVIVDWVETGAAPERVISTGNAFPGRARPLCPYPEYPHYTGGDPDAADSFVCRAP
jgi:hypothetical protein